jgi:hypothetical protein
VWHAFTSTFDWLAFIVLALFEGEILFRFAFTTSLVIAALLSQASAADGCKGDPKGEYFKKAGCEGKSEKDFTFK